MRQKTLTVPKVAPLRTLKYYRIALEAIVAILVLMWLYTGTSKFMEIFNFRFQMTRIPYLAKFASFLAYFVPAVEIVLGIMLVVKRSRLLGLIGTFALMLTFTAHVFFVLSYMKEVPCTCGGIISELNWSQHLALNIVLTLMAGAGIILHSRLRRMSPDHS